MLSWFQLAVGTNPANPPAKDFGGKGRVMRDGKDEDRADRNPCLRKTELYFGGQGNACEKNSQDTPVWISGQKVSHWRRKMQSKEKPEIESA